MSFLLSIAALLIGAIVLAGIVLGGLQLHFQAKARRPWLYGRRCLIAGVPWLLSLIVFFAAFAGDPLWPNQDMSEAQALAYRAATARAQEFYVICAALSWAALLWLARRAILLLRDLRRVRPAVAP